MALAESGMRFRFSHLAVSLAMVFPAQVTASLADFETEEYKSSNALNMINASEAYDLDLTDDQSGVNLGLNRNANS